jgi:hypothetical protein
MGSCSSPNLTRAAAAPLPLDSLREVIWENAVVIQGNRAEELPEQVGPTGTQ